MWRNTSITVDNKNYNVDVFTGVVDDTKNRTQTGISGGSFNTEKYGSSNISTTHTNFQEVWLVGTNNTEASISLKNNEIQARKGNNMSLVRVEGIDYWAVNMTTNTKYQLSAKPSKLFLPKEKYLWLILSVIAGIITFFIILSSKIYKEIDEGKWYSIILSLFIVFILPFFWLFIPYLKHLIIKKRDGQFDENFNSSLANAIKNIH